VCVSVCVLYLLFFAQGGAFDDGDMGGQVLGTAGGAVTLVTAEAAEESDGELSTTQELEVEYEEGLELLEPPREEHEPEEEVDVDYGKFPVRVESLPVLSQVWTIAGSVPDHLRGVNEVSFNYIFE
jgi:hypothetical protein